MLLSCETCLIEAPRYLPEEYFSSLLVHLPLNLTEKEKESLAQPGILKEKKKAHPLRNLLIFSWNQPENHSTTDLDS